MDIKPIETVWDGHRFRSRLEARWAVFFDELSIEYMYEPEGYVLPSGRMYLPDFYIPEFCTDDPVARNARGDVYIEVKGNPAADPDGISRAKEFRQAFNVDFFFIVGSKELQVDPRLRFMLIDGDYAGALKRPNMQLLWALGLKGIEGFNRFEHAQLMATQARFEHGEAPKPRREFFADLERRWTDLREWMK